MNFDHDGQEDYVLELAIGVGDRKMELHENLSYLDKIVASDLSVFFVENSTLKVEQIGQLCQDVGEVVDVFVESSTTVDMTDSHSLGFLKHTLPVIIEILLRRKSAR